MKLIASNRVKSNRMGVSMIILDSGLVTDISPIISMGVFVSNSRQDPVAIPLSKLRTCVCISGCIIC